MTHSTPPVDAPAGVRAVADDAPVHGASFGTAVRRFFTRYAGFSGRSSRSEYWWVGLLNAIVYVGGAFVALAIQAATGPAGPGLMDEPTGATGTVLLIVVLYVLATFVPSLALNARRLHDVNLSGWFQLLLVIPGGSLFMLVIAVLPGSPAGQRFDRTAPAAAR